MRQKTHQGAHRAHNRVQLSFPEASRTKQSFKKECDVNNIVAKFRRTGLMDHVKRHQGFYDDFTNLQGYHQALNTVMSAQWMFDSLPADIRAQFNNDPASFLEFAQDPANQEAMREMGLLAGGPVTPQEGPKRDGGPPEGEPPKEPPSEPPKSEET